VGAPASAGGELVLELGSVEVVAAEEVPRHGLDGRADDGGRVEAAGAHAHLQDALGELQLAIHAVDTVDVLDVRLAAHVALDEGLALGGAPVGHVAAREPERVADLVDGRGDLVRQVVHVGGEVARAKVRAAADRPVVLVDVARRRVRERPAARAGAGLEGGGVEHEVGIRHPRAVRRLLALGG